LLQVTQSINRLMFTNFCLRMRAIMQQCSDAAMQHPPRTIPADLRGPALLHLTHAFRAAMLA
jgi:hypothetical protein